MARGGVELAASIDHEGQFEPLPTIRGHYRIFRRIGEGASGSVYEAEQASPHEIYGLAFDPAGTTLATGAWDRAIRFWSVPGFEPAGSLEGLTIVPRRVVFSADGRKLFSSASDRGILVCDVESASIERIIPLPAAAWAVALSPDGKYLAAGLFDASVCLIDPATDEVLVGPGRHRLVVAGLAFSPDGKRLYSGGDDGSIREWSLETPEIGPRATRQLNPGLGAVSVVECVGPSRVFAGTGSGWLLDWRLDGNDAAVARNVAVAAEQYAAPAGIDPAAGLRWAESVLSGSTPE